MQCPNCKMNIKDDSKFCIHCGTQFNNTVVSAPTSVSTQPSVPTNVCPNCNASIQSGAQFCTNCGAKLNGQQTTQPVQTNQQVLANDNYDLEKYLRAYFGKSYDRVVKSNFSFGTFFFGWLWLLVYKLYPMAGKLFVTLIIVNVITNILGSVIGLRFLFGFIGFCVNIYFLVQYAKSFSSAYISRANSDISNITKKTQNEEEIIKECKKAAQPNYIALAIAVLIMIGIADLIVSLVLAEFKLIENSRKDSFRDTAHNYLYGVKTAQYTNELKCGGKLLKDAESGIYFYSFTTANGNTASKIVDKESKSAWDNADIAGQVYIYKRTVNYYQYALVIVDEDGRGIGKFDSKGKPSLVYTDILTRESVNTSNGDNRKIYYEKAKSGTSQALNVDTAPTLETVWDTTKFGDLVIDNNKKIQKQPIACEIIDD